MSALREAPAAGPAGLELVSIVKRRGDTSGSVFQLEVPYFSARPGEFVAVVGASGCGKSTLLDMLGLVSRPTEMASFTLACGHGVVDVADLWQRGDERGLASVRATEIGYILQTGGLLPFLSVRQNAALSLRIQGGAVDDGRIEALAARLDIADHLDKKPARLSGGQRQRAAILRAAVHRPRLILADEPTAAVDKTRAVGIVADFVKVVRKSGLAVVMVTHDVGLVEPPVADRVFSFEIEPVGARMVRSRTVEVAPRTLRAAAS
jgi:putative ABC transport system ATP-binding protein